MSGKPLNKRAIIKCTLKNGLKVEGKLFRCYYKVFKDAESGKIFYFNIGITKKTKKAVDRNKIKRLAREAFRLNKYILESVCSQQTSLCLSLYFFYKVYPTCFVKIPSYQEVYNDMVYLLTLIKQAISKNEQVSNICH